MLGSFEDLINLNYLFTLLTPYAAELSALVCIALS
jgi:hypothetical protein